MSKNRFKNSGTSVPNQKPDTSKEQAMAEVNQNDTTENELPEGNLQETGNETSQETQEQAQTQQEQVNQESAADTSTVVKEVEVKESAVKPAEKEGFNPVFKIELDLTAYSEAMDKAKPINPEEGGRWQYSLFTTIKNILNVADQEVFNKEWNTLLNFFKKNKEGIFNENFIFRFPEQWPGSSTEFATFRRIVFTVIQTADPKTRNKSIKDINVEKLCEGLTENQRNKLIAFYGM